ncbi:MAG: cytochrome c-type biogenesis protein CcmH [Steroidobacteraceae bacterium]
MKGTSAACKQRRRAAAASLAALLIAGALGIGGAWLPAGSARALDAYGQLEDPALQARFERITLQLRCLVCQNESIADSNVELAADLRRQVREMLVAGKSDDEIFKFMTDRYGEFVRFSPPLEPKTLLIWGAPFIMLLLGVIIIYRVVRQRSRLPLDDEPSPGASPPGPTSPGPV